MGVYRVGESILSQLLYYTDIIFDWIYMREALYSRQGPFG
jgi:hypothetical protein